MAQDKGQKERIMRSLKISAEEAQAILDYDKEVDRTSGGLEYDLSKEEQKQAIKLAHKGQERTKKNAPTVYKFDKRERKANVPKQEIISKLNDFLAELGMENISITNKERQVIFSSNGENYELTLVQKRKPKA